MINSKTLVYISAFQTKTHIRGGRPSNRAAAHGSVRILTSLWRHTLELVIGHRRLLELSCKGAGVPMNSVAVERQRLKGWMYLSEIVGFSSSRAQTHGVDKLVLCIFVPTWGGSINSLNFCRPWTFAVCQLNFGNYGPDAIVALHDWFTMRMLGPLNRKLELKLGRLASW